MERRTQTLNFVYVPYAQTGQEPSRTLSAAAAKQAAIDYILKRLILKPTE